MAKTYNINTFGTLTNTDGVLSGFSTTNYATINSTITYTNSFELNFKVTTSSDVSNLQIICCPDVDQEGVRLDINGGKFELLCGKNGTWFNLENYQGGTVQANTTYWIRASYDGNNAYKLEVSTDDSIYSTVISFTSTNKVTSNFTNYIIGVYSSFTLGVFNGSIDLNDSNINVNGIRTWRGVSVSGVTIQLRRDIAANWTTVNPILAQGEVGIETDTNQQKIGDGVTAWNNLPYLISYDSFDTPIVDYVAQTGTTWDETKLNYNSSSKIFTPVDTTANRNVYPITFNVPNNVNIDAYSTTWKFYIPNNKMFATLGSSIDNCCCQIYAESGEIAQVWYSANNWRRGDYSGGRTLGLNIYNNVPWDIRHYPANTTSTYVETIGGQSLSDGFVFNSNSGRLTKIVIYVNSQMNQNIAVGDVRLCLLDSGGNIAEEYPLFTEGSQPRVKLDYNTDNLTVNSSNQLDLSGTSKVIDGQWVENTIQLANSETLPDSTNIVYDLINLGCLPQDATTYQYEIYLDCILYGSATSGEFSNLQVSAGVFSSRMCYVISRGAALRSSNSATLPVSTLAKLSVMGIANNKGNFSLWFKGYRRIGTNA